MAQPVILTQVEIDLSSVSSATPLKKEVSTLKYLLDSQLSYTLADRTNINSKTANFFSSFNIPCENLKMLSGDTSALSFPEMFQMNVDKIVVIPISKSNYSDYIDGRSVTLKVPQWGGTFKKVISSFYSDPQKINKTADSPINYFGANNVAFLFSDDVNLPYSGTTNKGSTPHTLTSWDPTISYLDRPSAIAASSVKTADRNTDKRLWSSVNLAVSVNQSYPFSLNTSNDVLNGYNYDIPVGFVCLDKGYIVLTHPKIVNNIPWTSGSTSYTAGYYDVNAGENIITGSNAGPTSGTTNIVFTGTNITNITSTLDFVDISVQYTTSVICIAMPATFFMSKNPSWPITKNLAEWNNNTTNYDSIYVTQVGLYNNAPTPQLIAVAKLDRPIEKTYSNIITFSCDIQV